jgi:hypothetical protein
VTNRWFKIIMDADDHLRWCKTDEPLGQGEIVHMKFEDVAPAAVEWHFAQLDAHPAIYSPLWTEEWSQAYDGTWYRTAPGDLIHNASCLMPEEFFGIFGEWPQSKLPPKKGGAAFIFGGEHVYQQSIQRKNGSSSMG